MCIEFSNKLSTREEAIEILRKLYSGMPGPLLSKVEASQKGIGFVLAYLVQHDGEVIAGDLAKELHVSTARIAALLRTMEENGLVTRRNSVEDARRTVVEITQAGITRTNELKEHLLQKIELLLERVGKEDLEEFIWISQRIKAALAE